MEWEFTTATAEQTQQLAERLAGMLRAGDLIILTGGLGAGKTTFTQGLGRSLGVRPGIISPTFVLVRIHPNLPGGPNPGGPDLVHVDAYRLGSAAEIDDIDLENTMDTSVTVVEWGADRVEHLAANRLEITLLRTVGSGAAPASGAAWSEDWADDESDDEPRVLRLRAIGPRWDGADFSVLGQPAKTTD
ncbi:tRNA threonylcarbamoyladenosine biosynthesis protein TsaE [Arthrobacter silviterrae]|uniref:tRNA threonylcarbamoyladenosine biosynthesis protein TsaE n=1 Tax=Arthrobacter silviterrae TaxID=2026658 RepID=A0ABX0DKJ5_9MICC|nr:MULTISPECIES: tRNA (adenosine(37)-N6)-threonylcarbamoyltransferase complex ATPase subunit type 1 TsaE [Arthrobacter]MCU6479326.1 tRNA (adenosine(37)-N6)-threonylcarbamoyltransferase complex ATPase subunit type 1 TsaE [Arthrobacter sp. A2-55]MDQ0277571.1 tRNA threonylcarbamoyladenosine biosynthesis protein TsaE [Arthrobacter silviterrae]NGN85205.1 tRNA (adenosine(37)-N6)-threonylcarbamoyltransferase complex ATPase subunit type 1 TsaE [Arthrobacter silviterrae]